jgi:hypothetical protein
MLHEHCHIDTMAAPRVHPKKFEFKATPVIFCTVVERYDILCCKMNEHGALATAMAASELFLH